ncbi:peptidase T [Lewinellaceae bacterium SD302]|nr:peptidase T [Lewinellaceae bacterium SD302]
MNFPSIESRFIRYVKIDTQSDPHSTTYPSTEKQKDLSRLLVRELKELGIEDAEMNEHGLVYATIPASPGCEDAPTICFCSHVDTSPDASGKNIKPIVHRNYAGQDLVLPDDPSIVIRQSDHPDLEEQHGHDVITASGTTLLGADDKAGVTAIMAAAEYLMTNPSVKHAALRILFTPDEEIGRGVDKVDMQKLNADFGYTMDGARRGSMEDETFSADAATIHIDGVSAHPGMALGKLENAVKIASDIVAALPKDGRSPETTSDREGFVHPVEIKGIGEKARIDFIVREFDASKLSEGHALIQSAIEKVAPNYPNSKIRLEIKEQYRNMKEILDDHPQVVALAERAIEDAGLTLRKSSIRGGTDGSRLSFMGLPCPNIFTGEHAFHGKYEWVTVQDMEKAAEVIVRIVTLASK